MQSHPLIPYGGKSLEESPLFHKFSQIQSRRIKVLSAAIEKHHADMKKMIDVMERVKEMKPVEVFLSSWPVYTSDGFSSRTFYFNKAFAKEEDAKAWKPTEELVRSTLPSYEKDNKVEINDRRGRDTLPSQRTYYQDNSGKHFRLVDLHDDRGFTLLEQEVH